MSSKPRTYASVDFQVRAEAEDDAAGILVAHGALGCEVNRINRQSRITSQHERAVLLRAYFERITPRVISRLKRKLEAAGMLANGANPDHRVLVDPGWATMWQARFAPFPIGQRLLIVPPWRQPVNSDRIRVVIRPGQAFGTGHHPSTSGTLSAIERLCRSGQITRALDVGTGSGILAIAMVKMGVAEVTAIETDAAALANAKENARLNRAGASIQFSTTPLSSVRGRFGLIAANILSSTLIQLSPELTARLRRRGHLVLSGILSREAKSVADAYVNELAHVDTLCHGVWTTLIFQK
ncbi:MAG: 50S ribosomal protein L11 methyltransferase [Deltaproteobacteria bacterium]|nr:50S ribosomal protein L11 methyltransferase [Deltaproteobacteria bacterium]